MRMQIRGDVARFNFKSLCTDSVSDSVAYHGCKEAADLWMRSADHNTISIEKMFSGYYLKLTAVSTMGLQILPQPCTSGAVHTRVLSSQLALLTASD
jgi:hypothetical protein